MGVHEVVHSEAVDDYMKALKIVRETAATIIQVGIAISTVSAAVAFLVHGLPALSAAPVVAAAGRLVRRGAIGV